MSAAIVTEIAQVQGALRALRDEVVALSSKMDSLALFTRPKVTLPGQTNHADTMDIVIKVSVEMSGYTENELCGKARPNGLVEARHIAVFACWAFTTLGTIAIGKRFGNRDHGTVLHALEVVEARSSTERAFAGELAQFTNAVQLALGRGPFRDFSNLHSKSKQEIRTQNDFIRTLPNLRSV